MDFLSEDNNSADQVDRLPSNIRNSISRGRKSNHSFLQKLFFRQPSTPKIIADGPEDNDTYSQMDRTDSLSYLGLEVTPCPYIHPLGNRLEPRIESAPSGPRIPAGYSGLRNREGIPDVTRSWPSVGKANERPHNKLVASDAMSVRSSMVRENIVAAAAADASHLREWDYYIKCYSEGRYSMTLPPGPPPRNIEFTYLPSTYPPNELERLETFRSSHMWSGSDIAWSSLEVDCARSLIMAATTKLATPWAAISFFDRDTEIVQAERGYSRHLIPRYESIASHVLLTDEVMTVLDTQKDWRFSGNPLVIGSPKIRFFAGAPLLSENGQVIGVFAIFAPEPHASFTAMQRRDLMGLSEIATRELIVGRNVSSPMNLGSSPPRRPDPGNCGTTDLSNPPSSIQLDPCGNSSVGLRYHKASKNGITRSRLVINSEGNDPFVPNGEHTPPSSDDDAGPSPILAGLKGSGKNYKQLSLAFSPDQPKNDTSTPDSSTFDNLLQGSFSVTDPDYVYQEQNHTRADFFHWHNKTNSAEIFKMHGMDFLADSIADPSARHPSSTTEQVYDSSSLSIESEGRDTLWEESLLLGERLDINEMELVQTPTLETKSASISSFNCESLHYHDNLDIKNVSASDLTSKKIRVPVDLRAEAKFAAELWAKNLEFDTIYAVELRPKMSPRKQPELTQPVDIEARVLVAYGLPDSTNFDILIHLDVLSGPGAVTWQNKNAMPKEHSRGFMMPLLFKKDLLDHHSRGVVFGAFRRRPERLRSTEVERLHRAANVLKEIITKSDSMRQSSRGQAKPLLSPRLQPYPANEAIKVRKTSFINENASCAQEKKPKNPIRWYLGGGE